MEAFGDQFLARPALADHQHRALHGRRAAGALDGVEEGARLADELVIALHSRDIANCADSWQELPTSPPRTNRGVADFGDFRDLAHRLLNRGQQLSEDQAMYDRSFFTTRLGQAALASIGAMAAFVMLSTQITVTAPMTQMAVAHTVLVA